MKSASAKKSKGKKTADVPKSFIAKKREGNIQHGDVKPSKSTTNSKRESGCAKRSREAGRQMHTDKSLVTVTSLTGIARLETNFVTPSRETQASQTSHLDSSTQNPIN